MTCGAARFENPCLCGPSVISVGGQERVAALRRPACISAAQTWREVHREVHQDCKCKELPGSQGAELRKNRSEVADEGS